MTTLATTALWSALVLGAPPTFLPNINTVEFDGETYAVAFRSNRPEVKLIELVREGETVENWTRLFAVRNYPQQTDPEMAVAVFAQVLKDRNPLARYQLLVKEDRSEAMIDFLIWTPGEKQMEFNAHRYFKLPGHPGLVSFQFAYRIPDPSAVTAAEIRALRTKWVEELSKLPPPPAGEK